jgi:hypothetical protein
MIDAQLCFQSFGAHIFMASNSEPIRENNPAPDAAREPDIQANHSRPDIPPTLGVSTPPPTETHYKVTCEPEKDWWDKFKPFVEMAGIVILSVYTWYTIKMYYANKEAADAAQEGAAAANNAARIAGNALLSSKQSSGDTLDQMKNQSKSMLKSATASGVQADAAKNAVENAKQSLQATIEGFHLEQRPWAIPFQFQLGAEPENGKDIKVTIWVENTGKTPALDVIPTVSTSLWGLEPPQPDFSSIIPIVSRGILAPEVKNFSFDTGADHFKPKLPDVAAYLDARKRIYIHGIIRYRDSFNDHHWTTFCIWHKVGTPLDRFDYCEHGNDVDHREAHEQR